MVIVHLVKIKVQMFAVCTLFQCENVVNRWKWEKFSRNAKPGRVEMRCYGDN